MNDKELCDQTIEAMWQAFWRSANPNKPGRKAPVEVRVAYYAGSHNMLAKMLALFRQGEPAGDEWSLLFQKWADEMDRFVADYRNGKI